MRVEYTTFNSCAVESQPLRDVRSIMGVGSGLLALLSIAVLTTLAAMRDPEFVLFESWLSDLGVGPGAAWFNTGIIIGSALGIPFALLGLRPALPATLSADLGTAMFCIACGFGILAGVYTEEAYDAHIAATWGTFICLWVALGLVSYSLNQGHPLGRWFTELTESVLVVGVIIFVLGGNPLGETVEAVLLGIWLITFSAARTRQLAEGEVIQVRGLENGTDARDQPRLIHEDEEH
jgi:hypothetical membrane protein